MLGSAAQCGLFTFWFYGEKPNLTTNMQRFVGDGPAALWAVLVTCHRQQLPRIVLAREPCAALYLLQLAILDQMAWVPLGLCICFWWPVSRLCGVERRWHPCLGLSQQSSEHPGDQKGPYKHVMLQQTLPNANAACGCHVLPGESGFIAVHHAQQVICKQT